MKIAMTRAVSPRIAQCELSFIARQTIDVARAAAQHEEYERRLAAHGCTVHRVADMPELPDAVFVEDAAVVLDDVAVITRPGARSRRPETESVAEALLPYRELRRIKAPATLDGGDVLRIAGTLYVGLSRRTNAAAIAQLRDFHGVPIRFRGCLHLKSAVTQIDDRMLLINPEWVDPAQFGGFNIIEIDPQEPFAANALRLGDTLLYSASYPRTRRLLESRGYRVDAIDVSEIEKAEGGMTCCSLIFEG